MPLLSRGDHHASATPTPQLERVDAITTNVQQVTTNVSALTSLFAATLGSPVIKVAAFTYGVRRALADRSRSATRVAVKAELKAERKSRRAVKRAARNGRRDSAA